MRVFTAGFVQPLTVIRHEITESAVILIKRTDEKGEIILYHRNDTLVVSQFVIHTHRNQRTRIVIRTITVVTIGYGKVRMLQYARVVSHNTQVIEFNFGQGIQLWNSSLAVASYRFLLLLVNT